MNVYLKTVAWQVAMALVCFLAIAGVVRADQALSPAFYLPFDGTAETPDGQEPTQMRGLKFVPGIKGQAVYIGGHGQHNYAKAPLLEYDAENLFDSPSGTVMFWVSPSWDGRYQNVKQYPSPWYTFLSTMGGQADGGDFTSKKISPKNDYQRLTVFMYAWLRADMKQGPSAKGKILTMTRGCRVDWLKNDWWHIAITWDASGWLKLYVNGVASKFGNNYSSNPNAQKGAFALGDTQKMYVGGRSRVWTDSHRANSAIDELKIFSQALSDEQVWHTYRQVKPLDVVLDQRFIRADEKQTLTMEISPASSTSHGPDRAWKVNAPAQMNLAVRLTRDSDQTVVVKKTYVVKTDSPQQITLEIPASSAGTYRLTYVLDHGPYHYQKSHLIVIYKQKTTPVATDKPWTLGEPVVQIDTTDPKQPCIEEGKSTIIQSKELGAYRQAGNGKKDRIAYRIAIPDALIGKTTVLRVTWPDDRPRSMGLYMYRDMRGDKTRQHRDRLSGGIQSGNEYPLTHTMRTTEYLFFPWTKEYLFSARTIVSGYPAAVAKIELLPVTSRLPKLKLHPPKGLPQRHLGHMDEDQTFEIMLNFEKEQRFPNPAYSVDVLERLLDYFDYTGQDTLSYPFLRYNYSLNTKVNSNAGASFRTVGWQKLMLDMFARRGKRLIAMINLWSLPQAAKSPGRMEQLRSEGYFLVNRHGKMIRGYKKSMRVNMLNPSARQQFMGELDTILKRYGKHPGLGGIDLWLLPNSTWMLGNMNSGYGNLTVQKFEQDTGIHLQIASDDPARFGKRHDLLTGRYLKRWIKWRSAQNTRFVREVARHVAAAGKDIPFYLTIGIVGKGLRGGIASYEDFDIPRDLLETYSIDIQALKAISGVEVNLMRYPTDSRWFLHWFNGRRSAINELLWNPAKAAVFKSDRGSSTWNYYRYFESFAKSPLPAEFKAYFENADIKAHGRYFLQDYALSLASVDSRTLLAGAQPLGTSGRDSVAREFAKAFLALPAIPFADMPGSRDAVVARYAQTDQGTYLYLTNLTWSSVKASVNTGKDAGEVVDLSSQQVLSVSENQMALSLKTYETRSFRVTGKVKPVLTDIQFPRATVVVFNQQAKSLSDQIAILKKHGAETKHYMKRFRKIRKAINAKAFATAHRLIYSKLMAELPQVRLVAEKGYLGIQKKMIDSGRYNVNCGSDRYWELNDGRLFFPDQIYSEAGSYGYIGTYKQIGRPVRQLKLEDKSNRPLFASEAYDIEHYRFAVKPGKYTVRVYLKIGYMPKASTGNFVLSIDAEGTSLLKTTDIFTLSGGDPNRGNVVQKDNILVKDGFLDLYFKHPAGIDPTARMCNAIEVIPQK